MKPLLAYSPHHILLCGIFMVHITSTIHMFKYSTARLDIEPLCFTNQPDQKHVHFDELETCGSNVKLAYVPVDMPSLSQNFGSVTFSVYIY